MVEMQVKMVGNLSLNESDCHRDGTDNGAGSTPLIRNSKIGKES